MNIREKTIFDTLVNYCKNHDWISFDGEFFEVNRENLSIIMPEFKNKLLSNKNSTKWLLLVNYKNNIKNCNLKPHYNPDFLIKIIGLQPIKNDITTRDGHIVYEEIK
mgnify:CR=1 FL=1